MITISAPALDTSTISGPIEVTFNNQKYALIDWKTYEDLLRAKHNLDYLNKLAKSHEQYKKGQVVVKTIEELEAMAEEGVS